MLQGPSKPVGGINELFIGYRMWRKDKTHVANGRNEEHTAHVTELRERLHQKRRELVAFSSTWQGKQDGNKRTPSKKDRKGNPIKNLTNVHGKTKYGNKESIDGLVNSKMHYSNI